MIILLYGNVKCLHCRESKFWDHCSYEDHKKIQNNKGTQVDVVRGRKRGGNNDQDIQGVVNE